jgi:ribosome maturation factor RimP
VGSRAHFFVAGARRETALTRTELQDLLEPGAAALGFEVLAVELTGGPGQSVLRVYIDGPDGVSVDDCARASHQFSAILDVEDPIPGHYTLEVSSPGLDRPLTRVRHFQAVVGQEIRVRTDVAVDGRRRFRGRLRDADAESLEMVIDGETFRIPLSRVAKARLVPDYDEFGENG